MLAAVTSSIGQQVEQSGSVARVPTDAVANVRNDMYIASETIRFLDKDGSAKLDDDAKGKLKAFKSMRRRRH